MQMLYFDSRDELNHFLAEQEDDPEKLLFIKSIKTVVIKDVANFFVVVDQNKSGYAPRQY